MLINKNFPIEGGYSIIVCTKSAFLELLKGSIADREKWPLARSSMEVPVFLY